MATRAICLMATHNRPAMARRAFHAFLAQRYAGPATLFVYDDGDDRFERCSCTAPDRDVVLVRHPRLSLPAKRNAMMGVALALDEDAMFAVWDDDDWHGPDRLQLQLDALLAHPDADACLLRPFTLYRQGSRATHLALASDADATLAFWARMWRRTPWDERVDPGSGPAMIRAQRRERLVRVDASETYVVVRHDAHRTSAPSTSGRCWVASPLGADDVEARLRTSSACRPPRS